MARVACQVTQSGGKPDPESARLAMDYLHKDGFCVLDSVLPESFALLLRQEFEAKYSSYLVEQRKADALKSNRQQRLRVSNAFLDNVPEENKYLFSHVLSK